MGASTIANDISTIEHNCVTVGFRKFGIKNHIERASLSSAPPTICGGGM